MVDPHWFCGVDCGGTKTEAVISDDSGNILGTGYAAGVNLHTTARDLILLHINQAILAAGQGSLPPLEAVCVGLAGLDTPADHSYLSTLIHESSSLAWVDRAKKILTASDGLIGFKSGSDARSGICLISSTGSNCYGLNPAGHEHRAGDWGYLLGDQGSGFALGLKLLRLVVAESDGRKPVSALTPAVLIQLGLNSPQEIVPWAYQDRPPIPVIASLTHLLNDPGIVEDPAVQAIAAETVQELRRSYQAVVDSLGLASATPLPVVLIGGVFKLMEHITNPLKAALIAYTPTAVIILPSHNPVFGALKLAQDEAAAVHFLHLGVLADQH